MPLLPISPPPGYYRNGPNYSAKGRWKEGNLFRFADGMPKVIGGWERRTDDSNDDIAALIADPSIEAPRGIFSWRDNDGGRHIVVGTTTSLYEISASGAVTDITPASGFTAGGKDSSIISGFGVGPYGAGPFGTPRTGAGLLSAPVGQWRFDAWGEDLLAAGPLGAGTKLFAWSPGDTEAALVTNAPSDFGDFLVTNERIVMCVGTGDNGRGIDWSASEDRTDWTPAATNQAGSVTRRGTGDLLACALLNTGQILILGENDATIGQYLGPPYVYGFTQVGEKCGVVCAGALVVASDGVAYWMGQHGFFRYDGTVTRIQCDVADFISSDRSIDSISKCQSFTVSRYQEVWWLYQSAASMEEVDSYVSFNYATGEWSTGRLDRTTGMDKGITRDPVMVSPDGKLYNHELDNVLTGDETPYIRSGPIEAGQGDQLIDADFLIPALDNLGQAEVYLHCRDFPTATARTLGPYTLANPTPTYGHGREIEFEVRALAVGLALGPFRMNIMVSDER